MTEEEKAALDSRPWTAEEKAEWDEHPEQFFSTREEFERMYTFGGKGAPEVPPGTRVVIFPSTAHSDKGDWAVACENDPDWWLWAYRSREDSVALCHLMQWEIVEKEGNQ
jgi:hypothetical protein